MGRRLFAITTALATLSSAPREARALTCVAPGNHVLLPSATTLAPVGGPWLVLHEPDATVRLTDELGQEVPIESARTIESLVCVFTFDLYRPKGTIQEGALFTLEASSPGAASDSRDFVASSRSPRQVKRTLAIQLERTSHPEVLSNYYAEPLEGEQANGYFLALVTADSPTLMFLELSVADTKLGSIVEGSASLESSASSLHALSTRVSATVPELVTSSGCAKVVIRDPFDAVVYDKELCPKVGEKLEESVTAELAEHLLREDPEQEEGDCSCSSVGSRREIAPGIWLLLAAAALSLRRRALASAPIARTL